MFNFLPLINNSVSIGLIFFFTKHIRNNVIKNNQNVAFFI